MQGESTAPCSFPTALPSHGKTTAVDRTANALREPEKIYFDGQYNSPGEASITAIEKTYKV